MYAQYKRFEELHFEQFNSFAGDKSRTIRRKIKITGARKTTIPSNRCYIRTFSWKKIDESKKVLLFYYVKRRVILVNKKTRILISARNQYTIHDQFDHVTIQMEAANIVPRISNFKYSFFSHCNEELRIEQR